MIAVASALISALLLGAVALAVKRWGWRPRRGARGKAVEEAADFLDEALEADDSFPQGYEEPGLKCTFPDDRSTAFSVGACSSATTTHTAHMEALRSQFRSAKTEEEKVRVLQEARTAAETSMGTNSVMIYVEVLQQILIRDKPMNRLALVALGQVADMAAGKWEFGWDKKDMVRELLLTCHRHPRPEVRVKAIELTGELMKSEDPEDVDKAFEALQATITRLSRSHVKKEHIKQELEAVLATYKGAMGEDYRFSEVKEKIKAFVLKAGMGNAGKAAGEMAECLQPWLLETLQEMPAWRELRSMAFDE